MADGGGKDGRNGAGTDGRAGAGPPRQPAGAAVVRYNDWRRAAEPVRPGSARALPVSVVIPYYEAPDALARTLAGLERQTWPRRLFEVVVVDDGSRRPLERPAGSPLAIRVLRQEDRGFRLARARNLGAGAAAHDVLVFLDQDLIPEAGLLAAHVRWHAAAAGVLSVGFCARVSVGGIGPDDVRLRLGSLAELFAGRPWDPPWTDAHMALTGRWTARRDDLFRAVTGGNLGISRALFEEVGGFDESFTAYGGEDTEFGYRVQNRGGLLAPAPEAFAWHQGRWARDRRTRERRKREQRGKLAGLIAHPGFRPRKAGPPWPVPRYVVTLEAGDVPDERPAAAVARLLRDPVRDLVVRVVPGPGCRGFTPGSLERRFPDDPRVLIAPARGALDQFPNSPLHVTLRSGAEWPRGLLAALTAALGDRAAAGVDFEDGGRATIERAWALHRARRADRPVTDFGDVAALRWSDPGFAIRRRLYRLPAGMPPAAGPLEAAARRLWAEARRVRNPRRARRFLRWLAAAFLRRLRRTRVRRGTPAGQE